MRAGMLIALLLIAVFAQGMEAETGHLGKMEPNISEGGEPVTTLITVTTNTSPITNISITTNITSIAETEETETTNETPTYTFEAEVGKCNITTTYEDGYTTFYAICQLVLPTPCHKIDYSWLPGKETDEYVFTVYIKQLPGVCVQKIERRSIESSFRIEGRAKAKARITYFPARAAPRIAELRGGVRGSVQERELPPAALCAREHIVLRNKLRELRIAYYEAEKRNDTEKMQEIESEIQEVKEKLAELPDISQCARMSARVASARPLPERARKILEEIKETDLKLRILNPCDKLDYITQKIEEKKAELEGNLTEEEREAIEKEIAVLSDLRDNMQEACEHVRGIRECRVAVQLRDRIREIRERAQNGTLTEEDARKIRELILQFARVESACFKQIREDMDEHPCIAAQVLRIEVEKLTEKGDSELIDEIYEKMEEYREKCAEKARRPETVPIGPKGERASEVAKMVGELELAKYQILMDEALNSQEKKQKIVELEKKKLEIIRRIITERKRAKLSAAIKARIRPGKFEMEGEEISADNVTIEVPTAENETVDIQIARDWVRLIGKKAKVHIMGEIEFENGMIKFRGKAIKVPDEIVEKVRARIAEMELREEAGKPIYEGNATKRVRLLGIIPLEARIQVKADAGTGKIIQIRRPWWMIFALG